MWPITLSGRLPVVALVGRYPTNKLIGRDLLPGRKVPKDPLLSPPGHATRRSYGVLAGVSPRYSPSQGQIDHVLLTLSPLYSPAEAGFPVRLACLNHAANVRSEPGSNPSVEVFVTAPSTLCLRSRPCHMCLLQYVPPGARPMAAQRATQGRTPICL